MARSRHQRGFTIVELLIVIVVIAILAAISIVAYTGIQTRATNTQMVSSLNAYVKGISAYYTLEDTVPMVGNGVQCFDGSACWGGSTTAAAAMRANLREVMSTLPTFPSGHAALVTSGSTSDVPNGTSYSGWYVLYQVSGTNECPSISGLRYLNSQSWVDTNGRTCRAALEL